MEEIIVGKDFTAIITHNKPRCPKDGEGISNPDESGHDFSETVYEFHNDPRTLTHEQFFSKSEDEREELSISTGQGRCVKCGIKYLEYDNPNYL